MPATSGQIESSFVGNGVVM